VKKLEPLYTVAETAKILMLTTTSHESAPDKRLTTA
jgi:hypothetical protein